MTLLWAGLVGWVIPQGGIGNEDSDRLAQGEVSLWFGSLLLADFLPGAAYQSNIMPREVPSQARREQMHVSLGNPHVADLPVRGIFPNAGIVRNFPEVPHASTCRGANRLPGR